MGVDLIIDMAEATYPSATETEPSAARQKLSRFSKVASASFYRAKQVIREGGRILVYCKFCSVHFRKSWEGRRCHRV